MLGVSVNVVGATKEVNRSLYLTHGVAGANVSALDDRNVGLSNGFGVGFKSGQ